MLARRTRITSRGWDPAGGGHEDQECEAQSHVRARGSVFRSGPSVQVLAQKGPDAIDGIPVRLGIVADRGPTAHAGIGEAERLACFSIEDLPPLGRSTSRHSAVPIAFGIRIIGAGDRGRRKYKVRVLAVVMSVKLDRRLSVERLGHRQTHLALLLSPGSDLLSVGGDERLVLAP